jgi:hypothetical protein
VHFRWTPNNLFYIPDVSKPEIELIYPKKENREALITIAHEVGHYGAQSTITRLKENYY